MSDETKQVFTIRFQYGAYSGEREIVAADGDEAIAKMWADMRRRGQLGLAMAYTSATIVACRTAEA